MRRPTGVRGWAWAGLAALLVAVAAGVGYWHWRVPTPEPPDVPLEGVEPRVADFVRQERNRAKQSPRSAEAWGRLGKVLFANDFSEQAQECFSHAQKFAPSEPRWPYYQAIDLALRDTDKAEQQLRLAVVLTARAELDNVTPRLRLVELLLSLGKLDEAEKELASVPPRAARGPRVRYDQGLLAFHRERWASAQALLLPLKDHPVAGRLVAGPLAMIHQRLGQPEKAAVFSLQASKHAGRYENWPDPFVAEYMSLNVGQQRQLRLSYHMEEAGHGQESITMLQELVDRSKGTDPVALYVLGTAYLNQRQSARAIQAFRRSLTLAPNQFRVLHMLSVALAIEGDLLREQGQAVPSRACFEEAVSQSRKALALQPQDAYGQFQLGRCLTMLGRHADAVEPMRKAVTARPENARFHCHLAEVLAELGQTDEAKQCLQRGLKIASPDDPVPREVSRRLLAKWGEKP